MRLELGYLACSLISKFHNDAATLKDNIPHNTCQIYVKPHIKNTQMTLESQIFDEKALRQARLFSGILVAKPFLRRMHGGCHCCHSETVSFVVSLLSRDVPWMFNQRRFSHCSTCTSPISNKARANSMAASMHASMKMFWRPKIQKTDGLILVLSHRKFDILESFVCS